MICNTYKPTNTRNTSLLVYTAPAPILRSLLSSRSYSQRCWFYDREFLPSEKESCEFWWGFNEKFPRNKKRAYFVPREYRVKSESEQTTLAFLVTKISGRSHLAKITCTICNPWHLGALTCSACVLDCIPAESRIWSYLFNASQFWNQSYRNSSVCRCCDWKAFTSSIL